MQASDTDVKLGLIGSGIQFSLSPKIHNLSMKHLGIEGLYEIVDMPASNLAEFIERSWKHGALGFNVTTPHKRSVANLLKGCSLESVNTLYRGVDGWVGVSTDGLGLAQAILDKCGKRLAEYERIVFLGDGGVVSGVLEFLLSQSVLKAEIVLHARSEKFLQTRIAARLGKNLSMRGWSVVDVSQSLANRGRETLVIQASSAPQKGDNLSWLVPSFQSFSGDFAELTYNCESSLEQAAQYKKLCVVFGLEMLVEQARKSQELWWGKSAPSAVIHHALAQNNP